MHHHHHPHAGKHLFLEKPVARHADECQHIFDAAAAAFKATSARFFMAENSSFWPEVYRAKQLIREGAIGGVVTARSHYYEVGNEWVLPNAMTSSEERTSAEAEGCSIERALTDCVAPPSSCEIGGAPVRRRARPHYSVASTPAR